MKRAGVLFLGAVLGVGCGEFNREAVDDNNQGMGLLRANRYADAREKFQRAAEEDRRYALPLYNLALSYIRQKDWPNAIDALNRAIARDQNNAEYHYQLGNAHYQIATDPANAENAQSGAHYEQARTAFQNAIQKNRSLYMAHFRLGQIAEALDEPQAALRAYTDTIGAAPRAYSAYSRLGNAYMHNELFTEAAQVLRAGLQVAPEGAPERAQMHNILGLTLLRQNQQLPATEEFLAAIREDERLVGAMFSLGMTYAEMPDQRQRAIHYLNQFISARGGDAPPEYLAQAQARLGELQSGATP